MNLSGDTSLSGSRSSLVGSKEAALGVVGREVALGCEAGSNEVVRGRGKVGSMVVLRLWWTLAVWWWWTLAVWRRWWWTSGSSTECSIPDDTYVVADGEGRIQNRSQATTNDVRKADKSRKNVIFES